MTRFWTLFLVAGLAAPPALAQQAPPTAAGPTPTTSATPTTTTTPPTPPTAIVSPKPATPVVGKWSATIYGFAELDTIYDTRQGIGEVPGNPVLPHAGTYAGYNDRTQFSIRNTRLGFRLASPVFRGMKASGTIETDLFGNTPNAAGGASEGALYNNPGLRVRHAFGKLETPYVDLTAGQTWELFGWQPYFHPNTVELQGVPGQVYSRTAQLRLGKTFKTDPVNVDFAIAAVRPPQRDAGLPDGQAGLRLAFNGLKGARTAGSTGTSIDAAAVGVSGTVRKFALQTPTPAGGTADPRAQTTATGYGVSFDGLLPIIPATIDDRSNAVTLTGSYVRGSGIQDLYSGFSNGGGTLSASPGSGQLAGSNAIDNGLAAFDSTGKLQSIDVRSFIVGAQYYLPIDRGAVWVAGNYSQVNSDNADLNASAPRGAFLRSRWADACIFWDATPAVRFGAEYAWFENLLADKTLAHNQRYQLSVFYIF